MPVVGHVQKSPEVRVDFLTRVVQSPAVVLNFLHASVSFARSRGADTRVTNEAIFIIVRPWIASKMPDGQRRRIPWTTFFSVSSRLSDLYVEYA
jgi:hypothetical protein